MRFEDLPRGRAGTAAGRGEAPRALWMNPQELKEHEFWRFDAGKLWLGSCDGVPVGIADNRHLLTIAGTRAGKGTSVVIPNLLTYEGSVLCLDPKGENAELTAERRGLGRGIDKGGMGHEVYVIDPFDIVDSEKVDLAYKAGFNPISALDPDDKNFIDDCDSLADALVVAEPGKQNDHWNASARIVLRGFIAWIAASESVTDRSLNELKRLLFLPPDAEGGDGLDDILDLISQSESVAHGVPYEMANMLIGMGHEERGSVLSTTRQNLSFLASPPMAAVLSSELRSPSLIDWKHGKVSVYLCLPAGRLHRHARFFRIFINLLLAAVERDKTPPPIPALMLLDEMHVLGHMSALETASGLIAGYGVRIWSIWQDLNQLKHIYRNRWETFLGNAGVLQVFGLNDNTTLEYISKRLGVSSIQQISKGEISVQQAAQGFTGESRSIHQSPLLTHDEVAYHFSRQSGNQLVLRSGNDPIFMQRLPYYEPFFRGYLPK